MTCDTTPYAGRGCPDTPRTHNRLPSPADPGTHRRDDGADPPAGRLRSPFPAAASAW